MKKILLIAMSCLILASCTENEPMVYETKPAVYFEKSQIDSTVFSFKQTTEQRYAINIAVKLLGKIYTDSLHFKVVVDEEESTAVVGLDYEALADLYAYPKDAISITIPIYALDNESLITSAKSLIYHIESTDELDAGYPEYTTGKIIITNQIVKPDYWDKLLNYYFGEYSAVKHRLCIDIMGHDFPPTQDECKYYDDPVNKQTSIYGYWMQAGRAVLEYIETHEVYDENGVRISTWVPF